MLKVIAENYKGEQIELSNNPCFELLNVEGLNPTPASLAFTELAGIDGARFNSGRRTKRNIVITLAYNPPIEANRNLVYKYFPTKTPVKLYFATESRNVYINGYTETNEVAFFTRNEQSVLSIICPNPYFRSNEKINVDFSNTINLFEFPFAIDEAGIEFSEIIKVSNVIVNAGDISTGAIFTLTARTSQILNPVIYNNTTNQYFGLNVDLMQGDVITINTNAGEKSVTLTQDGVTTSIVNARQSGSKWLQLIAGDNEISYSCDEGAENLSVNVVSAACYEGL